MIGDRIAEFIDSGQFSKSSLAREIGVSRSLVGKWVSNKSRPSPSHIEKMAQLFNVGSAYLAGYEETPDIDPVDIVAALSAARAARVELDRAIQALEKFKIAEKPSNVVPIYERAADGGFGPDKPYKDGCHSRVACTEEKGEVYSVDGERADLGFSDDDGGQSDNGS